MEGKQFFWGGIYLSGNNRIGPAILNRNVHGASLPDLDREFLPAQNVGHGIVRLHGDDLPGHHRHEQLRELAGAGRELDEPRRRRWQSQTRQQEGDRDWVVALPVRVVAVGRREAGRCYRAQGGHFRCGVAGEGSAVREGRKSYTVPPVHVSCHRCIITT